MLFQFGAHSALLLPFVVPGLVLTGHLLVLPVAQWMLGYAGRRLFVCAGLPGGAAATLIALAGTIHSNLLIEPGK